MKDYKDIEELENDIKKNGTDDIVKVKGIYYTMDNYDSVGELITYGNKTLRKGLLVETANRYGINKFQDANIEEVEDCLIRNDINYYDEANKK